MDGFLHQVFAGLANGSIYGSVALALVMIFQATHHLNFAQGEMATFSTFVAWALIQQGWPYWGAFCATVAVSLYLSPHETASFDVWSENRLGDADIRARALVIRAAEPRSELALLGDQMFVLNRLSAGEPLGEVLHRVTDLQAALRHAAVVTKNIGFDF